MMTIGSLFAGVGGIELGLERTGGFRTIWSVEIDDYANAVRKRHWPDVPQYGDIRSCHSEAHLDGLVKTWYHPLVGESYTQEEAEMAGKLKKLTKEQAAECVRMYDGGISIGPIADYFDVSRQAMWDLLRRRTTMRPQLRFGPDNHFFRGGVTANNKAQNIVERALEAGAIVRPQACESCGVIPPQMKDGRSRIQSHHPDYNKPMDVMWLCQKCHHLWHKEHRPIRKEVLQGLAPVDVVTAGFP